VGGAGGAAGPIGCASPVAVAPAGKAGAYLGPVSVEGFRGIGPAAVLPLPSWWIDTLAWERHRHWLQAKPGRYGGFKRKISERLAHAGEQLLAAEAIDLWDLIAINGKGNDPCRSISCNWPSWMRRPVGTSCRSPTTRVRQPSRPAKLRSGRPLLGAVEVMSQAIPLWAG